MMPEIMQPLVPPIAFPKIPAQPPAKKLVIIPGRIIGRPNIGKRNMPITEPIVVLTKPIITALGAYGNKTGQSSAGFASGTSFIAIPRNAGTISASNRQVGIL